MKCSWGMLIVQYREVDVLWNWSVKYITILAIIYFCFTWWPHMVKFLLHAFETVGVIYIHVLHKTQAGCNPTYCWIQFICDWNMTFKMSGRFQQRISFEVNLFVHMTNHNGILISFNVEAVTIISHWTGTYIYRCQIEPDRWLKRYKDRFKCRKTETFQPFLFLSSMYTKLKPAMLSWFYTSVELFLLILMPIVKLKSSRPLCRYIFTLFLMVTFCVKLQSAHNTPCSKLLKRMILELWKYSFLLDPLGWLEELLLQSSHDFEVLLLMLF